MEPLTEKEEEVSEEIHVCPLCNGTLEVEKGSEPDDITLVPCPECCIEFYQQEFNDQDHDL